jgi:hypothetical protein
LFDYSIATERSQRPKFEYLFEKAKAKDEAEQAGSEARLKGKGKNKEILFRYAGEVLEGEPELVVSDPRKAKDVKKRQKPVREQLHELRYEVCLLYPHMTVLLIPISQYDGNSTGPPPATSVLVMGLSPITSTTVIRRHFSQYGTFTSFDPQFDRARGGMLGIVLITFKTHEVAKACVAKEDGRMLGQGTVTGVPTSEKEPMRVVLDAEGKKMKAVLREIEESKVRQKKEEEEKKKARQAQASVPKVGSGSASATPAGSSTPIGSTPVPQSSATTQAVFKKAGVPGHASLPQRPNFKVPLGRHGAMPSPLHGTSTIPVVTNAASPSTPTPSLTTLKPLPAGLPAKPVGVSIVTTDSGSLRRPPSAMVRARVSGSHYEAEHDPYHDKDRERERDRDRSRSRSRSRDYSRERDHDRVRGRPSYSSRYRTRYRDWRDDSRSRSHSRSRSRSSSRSYSRSRRRRSWSRSPSPYSPISRRSGTYGRSGRDKEKEAVLDELARNGWEYVKIDGGGAMSGIKEEDVKAFLSGFDVDKVCSVPYSLTSLVYLPYPFRYFRITRGGTSPSTRKRPRVVQRGSLTLVHVLWHTELSESLYTRLRRARRRTRRTGRTMNWWNKLRLLFWRSYGCL